MTITDVSTAANGTEGNGASTTVISGGSQISADGRYVVFQSQARNLVAGSNSAGIFVKDLQTGTVTLVSTASDGTVGNGTSTSPSISADGTRVAFSSTATNLVASDTNGQADIFVKDLTTGVTTRVDTGLAGAQATGGASVSPVISADGMHVAFASVATNLVANDTNGVQDIFVTDLTTGITTRVDTDSTGAQVPGGTSLAPSISADGTRVAFASSASYLVPFDTNGYQDIFVKDLTTGITTRVNTDSTGAQATGGTSSTPLISADGTRVAFASLATNLVAGDTNIASDVFVKNLTTGITTRVSTDSTGAQSNSASLAPSISADGTRVAFQSSASNLVAGDTNGYADIFVKDLTTGITTRVDPANDGTQSNGASSAPAISADGTRVVFTSVANNLVPNDTNGYQDVFVAPCFCAGTLVLTARGAVAVEDLAIGDTVTTRQGASKPVKWMGHRTVDLGTTRFANPEAVMPVRIRAGALGEGLPARDLLLSPDHAVLVGDVLVQAGALVNGTTVVRETRTEPFTFWHVELEGHDLIVVEGVPAETFVSNATRMGFDNWAEHQALFGDEPEGTEMDLPRVQSARQLPQRVRQMLAARVQAMGAGAALVAA